MKRTRTRTLAVAFASFVLVGSLAATGLFQPAQAGSLSARSATGSPRAADDASIQQAIRHTEAFAIAQRNAAAARSLADEDEGEVGALAEDLPDILSPATGSPVLASRFLMTLSTGATGAVAVLVDNEINRTAVTEGPGVTTIGIKIINAAAGSSHTVAVAACTTAECTAYGAATDSIEVITYPETSFTASARATYFSPNGDGFKDTIAFDIKAAVPGTVTYSVTTSGSAVVASGSLGEIPAGTTTWSWDGKTNDGAATEDGYRYLDFVYTLPSGSSRRVPVPLFWSDTVAPVVATPTATVGTVFPYKDGYQDAITVKTTINEAVTDLELRIYSASGTLVRRLDLGSEAAGAKSTSWSGRRASGTVLPAGTYKAVWWARDLAGNQRTSGAKYLKIDLRKLVSRTGTRTVTPAAVKVSSWVGNCSKFVGNPNKWTGAHGYYSLWDRDHDTACVDNDNDDLVYGEYALTLPSATRLGNVKLSATGKSHAYTSTGAMVLLRNDTEDGAASTVLLKPAYGTYSTPSKSLSALGFGRTVRWLGIGANGAYYDIRSFKVTWQYYVLVS